MSATPIKYPPPASQAWALWQWCDIPDKREQGTVYLRRLRIVQTPLFSVYVHWIFEADYDRDPHDHPWDFWSLIMRGGYAEDVYVQQQGDRWSATYNRLRTWGRWSVHKMPVDKAHMITSIRPGTVTLVLTGRRQRVWGFWTPDGWVNWRTYVGLDVDETEALA